MKRARCHGKLAVAMVVLAAAALSLVGCASQGAAASRAAQAVGGVTVSQDAATGSATSPASPKPLGGKGVKTIYLAGGCFWGTQKFLDQIHGVLRTEVGYANGASNSATYGDGSGYAEAVRVDYDPAVAPLPFVLRLFYKSMDPTTLNRQGNDVGTEYRSGIYYTDPADLPVIEASLAELQKRLSAPIAIETGPLRTYATAEEYHQDYLVKNPGGYCHIAPGLFGDAAAAKPLPGDFAAGAK